MGRWRKILGPLLDSSVVFSYGRFGYGFRAPSWSWAPRAGSLEGKTVLVTGANSGIGFALTRMLGEMGATVLMACRSVERGAKAEKALRQRVPEGKFRLLEIDVACLASIREQVAKLGGLEGLHALVHNAGILPAKRECTPEGFECAFATNVLGPFLLTQLLLPKLIRGGGRLIHVTSGGMYTQRLRVDDLNYEREPYDGVRAYAQTKRARVILNELWARELQGTGVSSMAMHPGWVATPGVATSLPGFHRLMNRQLRTPEMGADTIAWLVASDEVDGASGKLFLDRGARRTHVFPWTRSTPGERQLLWDLCQEQIRREELSS